MPTKFTLYFFKVVHRFNNFLQVINIFFIFKKRENGTIRVKKTQRMSVKVCGETKILRFKGLSLN